LVVAADQITRVGSKLAGQVAGGRSLHAEDYSSDV
jgi:hypothetical protein